MPKQNIERKEKTKYFYFQIKKKIKLFDLNVFKSHLHNVIRYIRITNLVLSCYPTRFLLDGSMGASVFKKFALLMLIGYSKIYIILSYFLKINVLIYVEEKIPSCRTETTFCICLIVPLNPYSSGKAMIMYLLTCQQNIW